ncbi:hypothetical protein 2016_scaffold57_00016 [Bacteriophage sp.]|nr:hypothetical protein 2016_scaffold57_00016 [Bacteriophage sp.]
MFLLLLEGFLFCLRFVLLLPLVFLVAVFGGLYPPHNAALSSEGCKYAGDKGVWDGSVLSKEFYHGRCEKQQ